MNTELSFAIQQIAITILLSLISALVPVVTYQVIVYVRSKAQQIKSSLNSDLLYAIETGARIVVSAVEQESIKGIIGKTKVELKQDAIGRLVYWLSLIGLKNVDQNVLSDAIESALRQGFHNLPTGEETTVEFIK